MAKKVFPRLSDGSPRRTLNSAESAGEEVELSEAAVEALARARVELAIQEAQLALARARAALAEEEELEARLETGLARARAALAEFAEEANEVLDESPNQTTTYNNVKEGGYRRHRKNKTKKHTSRKRKTMRRK